MTREVFLVSNADAIAAMLERRPAATAKHLKEGLRQMGAHYDRVFITRQFGGYTGKSKPRSLQTRSGQLKRSLGITQPRGNKIADLRMEIGIGGGKKPAPYAKIHEFGGTVVPTGGRKYLTIPMPYVLTRAGRLKQNFRLVKRGDKWFTANGIRTFIYTHGDKKYIAIRKGGKKSKKIRTLYRLVPQVRIPAGRLGFFRTWREMKGVRDIILQRALDRAMKDGTDG